MKDIIIPKQSMLMYKATFSSDLQKKQNFTKIIGKLPDRIPGVSMMDIPCKTVDFNSEH